MPKFMIFPWMKRNEVERVYNELYSDVPASQRHAIGRIAVWQSRALHKLPVALESTAAFVSANLEYRMAALSRSQDLRLRNLYSIALLRFINHITEKGQSKTYAKPVHRIAGEIGVPEWVVTLRHEATHNSLPSLTILRAAAQWSLHWLKVEFWEVQIVECSTEKRSTQIDLLRDMLVTFQQQRFEPLSEETTEHTNEVEEQVLNDIEMMFLELGSEVCPILTENGYLVYTEEQLASLGHKHTDILKNSLLLPPKVLKFWIPIFRRLQKHDLVTSLLLHMVSVVTEEKSLRNKVLCGWMYTIIKQNSSKKSSGKGDLLFLSSFPLPYKQLMEKCILVHCGYSRELLNLLLKNVDRKHLSETKVEQLRKLMSTYFTDQDVMHLDITSDPVHSVKDREQLNKEQMNKWFVCSEPIDWSSQPFGVLPNQTIGYKSLELGYMQDEEEMEDSNQDLENLTEGTPDGSSIDNQSNTNLWTEETVQSLSRNMTVF